MDTTELLFKIILIALNGILVCGFWSTFTAIKENTERAADALEYIASRLDQESADNALDKIEKEPNSR